MATPRNAQLVNLLSADFRRLYNPAHALGDVLSLYGSLPFLSGFWPGSNYDSSGRMVERGGAYSDLTLTRIGTPLCSIGPDSIVPTTLFDGSTYVRHASSAMLAITGTETYTDSNYRGLTVGAWVRFDAAAAAAEYIVAKDNVSTARSYYLYRLSSGEIRMGVYDGASHHTSTSLATVGADEWAFVAGRFDPSNHTAVWLNGTKKTNSTAPLASIASTSSYFTVAGDGNGTSLLTGQIALVFLCAGALPDEIVATLYDFSRPLFGID